MAKEETGYYKLPGRYDVGRCRSCGAAIVWIQTGSGARMPLDLAHTRVNLLGETEAKTHFATCPQGRGWSKRNQGKP